jgi:hypothetical protein
MFKTGVAVNLSVCEYTATWDPPYPGAYTVAVYLTFANGSAWYEPSETQRYLLKARRDGTLMEHYGRTKDIGLRHPKMDSNPKSKYQVALMNRIQQHVPGSPLSVLARGLPDTALEPWCADADTPGMFVSPDACKRHLSCAAQGAENATFLSKHSVYVWKPRGCRLKIFAEPAEFVRLYKELKGHGRSTPAIIFAGDSLLMEEFCALKHFLKGEDFWKINCDRQSRGRATQLQSVSISAFEVFGFYDSYFGWRDLTGRTEKITTKIINDSNLIGADATIIFLDGAHSLEKNDMADYLRTLKNTARLLLHEAGRHRIVHRQIPSVHDFGPCNFAVGKDIGPYFAYHRTPPYLSSARTSYANEKARAIMKDLNIPSYEASIPSLARPELTRDKMHSGQLNPDNKDPTEGNCQLYCSGQWTQFQNFDIFHGPILPFFQVQILLNVLLALDGPDDKGQ